jgi:hypothetical protein
MLHSLPPHPKYLTGSRKIAEQIGELTYSEEGARGHD